MPEAQGYTAGVGPNPIVQNVGVPPQSVNGYLTAIPDAPAAPITAFRPQINTNKNTMLANLKTVLNALEQWVKNTFGNGFITLPTIVANGTYKVIVPAFTAFVSDFVSWANLTNVSLFGNVTNYLFIRQDGVITVTTGTNPDTTDGHGDYLWLATVVTDVNGNVGTITTATVAHLLATSVDKVPLVAADPAQHQAGDKWYRTDTNQLCVDVGGGVIKRSSAYT